MKTAAMAFVTALIVTVPAWSQSAPNVPTWKDVTGTYQVEATFVGLEGESVRLRKTDGVEVVVPLARLDGASRDLARRLAAGAATPGVTAAPGAVGKRPPPVVPPDLEPAELLKKARVLFEQFPDEAHIPRTIVPKAIVEYLYGDREAARRDFARAREVALKEADMFGPYADFGLILQGQHFVGATDDAKETIRIFDEACRKMPDDQFRSELFMTSFGAKAIEFLADIGADDEARKFIAEMRLSGKAETAQSGRDRVTAYAYLARLQWDRGDRDAARATLSYVEKRYPAVAESHHELPAMWYRVGETEKGVRLLDGIPGKQAGDAFDPMRVSESQLEMAFACLEKGDQEGARRYFNQAMGGQLLDPAEEAIRFRVRQEDYEAAAAEARKATRGAAGETPAQSMQTRLRRIAVSAARKGKPETALALLREADAIDPKPEGSSTTDAMAQRKIFAAAHRMAAGDLGALVAATDETGDPAMRYFAYLSTAMEIHVMKTGRGANFLLERISY